jgi:hypothetical protein
MGSRVWLSGQNALMQNFSAGTNTWRLTIFFDFLNENRKDQRLEGLLGMINMIWGRGFGRKLGGGRVWDALEKG